MVLGEPVIPKPYLYGPVLHAVIGAGVGVAFGIIYKYSPICNRVALVDSVPITLASGMIGCLIGCPIYLLYKSNRRFAALVEFTTIASVIALLFVIGGGVFTSSADRGEGNPPPKMFYGLLIGGTIGGVLSSTRLVLKYYNLYWRVDYFD